MKMHEGHARVQEQGCCALKRFAVIEDNEVKIVQAGGIEVVISAMKEHEEHAEVQQAGCGSLTNLCLNADNQGKVAQAGGIEVVVSEIDALREE
jgi:hypothetical protein